MSSEVMPVLLAAWWGLGGGLALLIGALLGLLGHASLRTIGLVVLGPAF